MNILHIASEVAPFSKTGGLGDVVGALPRALVQHPGVTARVVSARYGSIVPERYGLARRLRKIAVPLGDRTFEIEVFEGQLQGSGGVPLYLIEHPLFADRPGLYGPPERPVEDYPDNALRFALLSRGALAVAEAFGLRPNIVHAHDWQAALALYYARRGGLGGSDRRPATVLTIHNLAFQGRFPLDVVRGLGVDPADLTPEGMEFYGQASLLKGGILEADRLTTVSPRYAQEIQTEAFGCGMEGLLRKEAGKLTGILNGADYERWSPWQDAYLPEPYGRPGTGGVPDLAGKARCKAELQRELGLHVKPRAALCATITRLTQQKGIELILQLLESEEGWRGDMQYVLVGSGEPQYEERLRALQGRPELRGRMAVHIGYDDPLAHRVEAGADIYVMPSLFEPCGLNQMYSLRYGTIPVVRAVGGLDDSVVDYDGHSRSGTGFKFGGYDARSLGHALHRALTAYHAPAADGGGWQGLQRRAMRADNSWGAASRAYLSVYQHAKAASAR